MVFLSHISKDKNDRIIKRKELIVHIRGLLDRAKKSVQKTNFLHWLDLNLFIEIIIKLHDLGKYSSYFQKYLKSGIPDQYNFHHHSLIGAVTAKNIFQEENIEKAVVSYFIIKHHHSNLQDIKKSFYEPGDGISRSINNQLGKQYNDLLPNLSLINQELNLSLERSYLANIFPDIQDDLIRFSEQSNIQNYFLINYLFSLLIEADKLDASDTKLHTRKPIGTDLVNRYRPLSIVSIEKRGDVKNFNQDQLRSYVRLTVLQFLERDDWNNNKLFTLTAPTGIGKTLIALDFALNLKAKIRKAEQREAQIIYALPFINIIEQSYQVYEQVFANQNINLLAHYQYADALEQTSKDETDNYNQKMMILDTWQCDVVITTFVQFLQTLIGNRNKLLKKFNHFAGSIIILDEVQTIRLGQLPLIGASLYYLSKFLNARIVLMTATKPKIFELANQEIVEKEGEKVKWEELLPNYKEVFECFKRTKIVSLISKKLEDENDFVENLFSEKWSDDKSCIIVCNTVKRSLDVFNLISEKCKESKNPVYYLSTNIVPTDRLYIIERIKLDLRFGKASILIATQVVEAGVDLDFDMGFRDLGPIDSIIQVAGRINRNNNPLKEYSTLYIIDFGDCGKIYDPITQQQASNALNSKIEINEEDYLELVEKYFEHVAGESSFANSKEIFNAMKTLKYDSKDPENDIAVSSFQVINEKFPTLSVFIEVDHNATKLKNLFNQMIHKEISQEEFSPFKKDFHQHIIAIPSHLPKAMELKMDKEYLLCEGIYFVPNNELINFYNSTTGFDRSKENKEHSRFF